MVFRADEAARIGYEQVENYLLPRPREVSVAERESSKTVLLEIAKKLGPAIDTYPTWHPLVTHHDSADPITTPSDQCGYKGLDHTRYFANGFITCPYGDGQDVIDSVNDLPYQHVATITAQKLDVQLYNHSATPILVECIWNKPLEVSGMIPLSIAMPLILEKEVPCWEWAHVAETWETMRYYLLGSPHGSRSSLFVSQETGQAIKKIWTELINSGMFGPIKEK